MIKRDLSFLAASILILVLALHFFTKDEQTSPPAGQNRIVTSEIPMIYGNPATLAPGNYGHGTEKSLAAENNSISRAKELAFMVELPQIDTIGSNVRRRGPFNIGGRSRGIAIDVTDTNKIFAGGVSGGLWLSEDGGDSWALVSSPELIHNVTAILQDTRPGKTDTWYYGTGEFSLGNSTKGISGTARIYGSGIYKSTDGGQTWDVLAPTEPTSITGGGTYSSVIKLALDTVHGTLYAATFAGVYKSNDEGQSWTGIKTSYSSFCDVETTPFGITYISVDSRAGADKGVYKSTDGGSNWTDISPSNGDALVNYANRMVLAAAPSDSNTLYVYANTGANATGSNCADTWYGLLRGTEHKECNSFWKVTVTSTSASWENRSDSLPVYDTVYVFENLFSQGSYNMCMEVHPDSPDVVFLGATNIYRSDDAFLTLENVHQIGGYKKNITYFESWPNHHPDIHWLTFMPGNPDILFSAGDGGLHRTNDCWADSAIWVSLNNGFQTTQVYGMSIDEYGTSDGMLAGFQDNGVYWNKSSASTTVDWNMPLNGDGYFCIIRDENYYMAVTPGMLYKITLNADGSRKAYKRIDPDSADNINNQFNPFVIDPNDPETMYYGFQNGIYRHTGMASLALDNSDEKYDGWEFIATGSNNGSGVMAVSQSPADILYASAGSGLLRIENASTSDWSEKESISPIESGFINEIAIDPEDADKLMVVVLDFRMPSVYYTEDGGQTWMDVSGNLEESPDGQGNGPSVRSCAILKYGDERVYIVGTSAGACITTNLTPYKTFTADQTASGTADTIQTTWKRFGWESMGAALVERVDVRQSDGLIAFGTHGNGLFSTYIDSISFAPLFFTTSPDSITTTNQAFAYQVKGKGPAGHDLVMSLHAAPDGYTLTEITTKQGTMDEITYSLTGTPTSDGTESFAIKLTDNTTGNSIYQSFDLTVSGTGELAANELELSIYPNPASDLLHVSLNDESPEGISLQIFNQAGQVVKSTSQPQANELSINVSDLPNGTYYVAVSSGGKKNVRRVVVVN